MLPIQLSPSYSIYMIGHTVLRAWQGHPIPPPSLPGGEGSSFPGCVTPDDMVSSKSVMGVTPGNFAVVIGCQVDEFTCTWSAECFVAESHLNYVIRITLFWTKQSKTLSMVLILFSWTLLTYQNWMYSLMRLLPCLLQSHQELASSIKCCTL